MWAGILDTARGLDAGDPGHLQIHDYQVGLQLGCQGDSFLSRRRLAGHDRVWQRAEQCTQPAAEKGVIVGYEDA